MPPRLSKKGAAWLNRKADFETSLNADETEFTAIRFGEANLEEGLRDNIRVGLEVGVRRESGDEWLERDTKIEGMASALAEEIERRILLLGESYPFKRDKNRLSYRQSKNGVYEFCLAVTLSPSLTKGDFSKLPVVFELLARDTLSIFSGQRSQAVRTGAPKHLLDGLPARGKPLFDYLHRLTGEWNWRPKEHLPNDPPYSHAKDFGLDVVGWIPSPDDRLGHLFLLAQCACGVGDWDGKLKDLNVDRLSDWLELVTATPPVRCFFVPFHLGNVDTLREVCRDAGLVFDRARITRLAEFEPKRVTANVIHSRSKWVELVLAHPRKKKRKKKKTRGRTKK